MIKKIVLDKADRVYHFPFDIEEFFPKRTIATGEEKIRVVDLGHFRWPEKALADSSGKVVGEAVAADDLYKLKESIAEWLAGE